MDRIAVFLVGLAILVPACVGSDPGTGLETNDRPSEEAERGEDSVLFPTHGARGLGQLPIQGPRLSRLGRCLVMSGRGEELIVRPEETSFRPDLDGGAVVDENGEIIVRVGEDLPEGGGAYVPPSVAQDLASEELPKECDGKEVFLERPGEPGPDRVGCCLMIEVFGPEYED